MSTKKLDAAAVEQLVKNAGKELLENKVLAELIGRIRDLLPTDEPAEEKPPAQKKQFVVLVSDPLHEMPDGEEFAAWVLQIPDSESPLSTNERIETAAANFNSSKRGRVLPVQTVGETLESVPAKALKDVELWCKTKTPVLVVITRNELPNTDSLLADDNRGGPKSAETANVTTRDGRKVTPTAMLDEINAKFAAKIGGES